MQNLYDAWRAAEQAAHAILAQVEDDMANPGYVEAHDQAHAMLLELLKPSLSAQGALIKLKITAYFEDYLRDAQDPTCTVIAPRAVMSAINDLETLLAGDSAA